MLYIPIWFYSNLITLATPDHGLHFTFQSGSIQIQWVAVCRCPLCTLHSNLVLFKYGLTALLDPMYHLYIPIWFYSNPTIRICSPIFQKTLHSNLVLFKFYFPKQLLSQVNLFTFQSGSIQMDYHIRDRRLCYFFTFQSGSIQIISSTS